MFKKFILTMVAQFVASLAILLCVLYFSLGSNKLSWSELKKTMADFRQMSVQGADAFSHREDLEKSHLKLAAEASGDPSLAATFASPQRAESAPASRGGAACNCPVYNEVESRMNELNRRLSQLEAERAESLGRDRASLQDPNRGKIRIIR